MESLCGSESAKIFFRCEIFPSFARLFLAASFSGRSLLPKHQRDRTEDLHHLHDFRPRP